MMKYVLIVALIGPLTTPSMTSAEFDSLKACQAAYELAQANIKYQNGWGDKAFFLGVCAKKGD